MLALVPALIYAQTTQTTVVVTPQTQVTATFALAPGVVTRTIIITAPVDQISSIIDAVPKSAQLQQSVEPGQTLPITINGYVTSIVIPDSASIPTGVTLSPITPAFLPAPTIDLASAQSAVSNSVNNGIQSVSSVLAQGVYRHSFPPQAS